MAQEYWKNKHVVVTGGAFGIGRCLVEEFSKEGAVVAFLDKEKPPGEALETALRQKGYAVHFFPGDAGQEKTLESLSLIHIWTRCNIANLGLIIADFQQKN